MVTTGDGVAVEVDAAGSLVDPEQAAVAHAIMTTRSVALYRIVRAPVVSR
ncbi:MAG: hypothetical protein ACLP3C_31400 [Mycobacterium sp.]